MLPANYLRWDSFRARVEGVYSDSKNDRGGPTLYGFPLKWHPDIDPKTFTPDQARERAYRLYWLPIRGDELPADVALVLADWCFNSGDPRGHSEPEMVLQRMVGAKSDGDIGPKTVAAVWAWCNAHSARDLAEKLHSERGRFLTDLIRGDLSQLANLKGWWVRTLELSYLFGPRPAEVVS